MKNLYLIVLLIVATISPALSQNRQSKSAVHAKLNAIDYGLIQDGNLTLGQGFEVGLFRNFNNFMNIGLPFKLGLIKLPGSDINTSIFNADAVLQIGDMRTSQKISPYLFGGGGGSFEKGKDLYFNIPFGIGLNLRLSPYSFINLQGEMRKSLEDKRDNLQLGAGYVYLFHKRPDNKPLKTPPTDNIDTDKDGIPDVLDHCPNEAGISIALGCPDMDMDSVADFEDRCPKVAGSILSKGCPDTDKDGFSDGEDKCPDVSGPVNGCPDGDNDGFADNTDECPDEAGRWNGCPDSDFDGVADKDDKCPRDPGSKENFGCPKDKTMKDTDGDGILDTDDRCPDAAGKIKGCPDTDGDGIADIDDPCPTAAGKYGGCPDTDNDGVADNLDKCPTTPGSNTNFGCPEIKAETKARLQFATKAVQFETGKSVLLKSSYSILDEIVQIMSDYPDYYLVISGHTDNISDENRNMTLSLERATTCYGYLESKGVVPNRIRSRGFGESSPISDNNTAAGRELNRRVEFNLLIVID